MSQIDLNKMDIKHDIKKIIGSLSIDTITLVIRIINAIKKIIVDNQKKKSRKENAINRCRSQ